MMIKAEEVLLDGGAKRSVFIKSDNKNNENADDVGHNQNVADDTVSPTTSRSAAQSSLGVRILKGKSLVTLSNVLTKDEIDYIVKESLIAANNGGGDADDYKTKPINRTIGSEGRVCIRMPTQEAANRNDSLPGPDTENLDDPLPHHLSEFLQETILERCMAFIDMQLDPSVKTVLFGDVIRNSDGTDMEMSILHLYKRNYLEFSTREPALNVYYPPDGHFSIHKDAKALTILIPLCSPDEDFTGGGTAFWGTESHPIEGVHTPSLVMTPKAGTVLLFGGRVSHKGLHIQSGIRVVFVASFSKFSKKKKTSRTVFAR